MAGYFTIDGDKFFYQAKVEGLSDEAFRLHTFCLCGPGRTMLGVRRFTVPDAAARFPHWKADTLNQALAELEAAGLVIYDRETRLLLATLTFEHAPIKGYKSLNGAARRLTELPDSPVLVPVINHMLAEAAAAKSGASKKMTEALAALEVEFSEKALQP